MTRVINFLLNTLNSLWFALISDPMKSITAFASIIQYQEQSISPSTPGFVGKQRVIGTFQEFQKLEISKEKCLQIIPYVITGCAKRSIGKKAIIKLGNLGDAATW